MSVRVLRLALLACIALAGCSRSEARTTSGDGLETLTLRYQGQTGYVSYPELAEDLGYLAPLTLDYVGNTISGPQDIQTVATGDIDFGLAFNGAILKLAARHAPVRAVVGGYGIDEQTYTGAFVLEDSHIRTARDLIGKKVAANTLGAHSEFILREYLRREGLTPEEAKQVELIVLPPVNTEQALRKKQIDAALMLGIIKDKAVERGGLRALFSDKDLYGTFTAGCYVVSKKLLEEKPRAVRKLVEGVARAIEWARATPREQVVTRLTRIIEKRKRAEDASAVQYWKSTGIAGKGGLIAEKEFQVWLDWLVRDGEIEPGQLKLGDLYTNELNPFE